MKITNALIPVTLGLLLSASAFAAAGNLDPSFGNGGKVYAVPSNFVPAHDVAIQADGKIVIVGSTVGPDSTQDFGIVRLNRDGTPDTEFGSGGLLDVSFDNLAIEGAISVAIQSDGKIIVAGSDENGSAAYDIAVVRLNSDGTTDTTFSGGKVKIDIGGDDFPWEILVQPDGKIVLVGTARPTSNNDIAIVRLTPDGTLDTTFNGTGKVTIGGADNEVGNALALQSDGKIVVAGSLRTVSRSYFFVTRVRADGVVDSSFGTSGIVQTAMGTTEDSAETIAIQPDDKIVVGGLSRATQYRAAFARYDTTGALDPTFDTDGKLVVNLNPNYPSGIRSIFANADGTILGIGSSQGNFALVRLKANGSLDSRFGNGGIVLEKIAPVNSSAYRATIQPDGKIVAVGDGSDGSSGSGFTAARFLTDSRPVFDFDGDGKTDIGITRPLPTMEWWINRSGDGQTLALQFGSSTDKVAPADYTGDGKTDITFWRPATGEWYVLRSEDNSFFSFPFGANGDISAPADFDGDGKGDFAVFRPSTATWFIRRSIDGQVQFVGFGANGDMPIPSDYDGDGRADVAIYRNNNGIAEWWINRSTAGLLAMQFGSSTDKMVPGDYTGDGRTDVAFWRPSTGEWYIVRSEDFSYFAFPFGANSDTPAPGDYDGDGKFDPTVFRPSSATWFIARSTAGTQIVQFGANGDRPIPNALIP